MWKVFSPLVGHTHPPATWGPTFNSAVQGPHLNHTGLGLLRGLVVVEVAFVMGARWYV